MKHIALVNVLVILILTSCSPAPTALPTMFPTVIPTSTVVSFATPTQIPFDQVPFDYVSFSEPQRLWSENAGRIFLKDHYLYVEDLPSRALFVYDLVTDPQLRNSVMQLDFDSNFPITYDLYEDFIYISEFSQLQIYSIKDPTTPLLLGKKEDISVNNYNQVLATKNVVYLSDGRSRLDVRNMNGDLLSRLNFSHPNYKTEISPIHYSNGYLYVAVARTTLVEPQRMEQSFRIYKTDDFSNFSSVGSFALPSLDFKTAYSTDYTINVRDNYVFLTWWASPFAFVQEATDHISGELVILDVQNPNDISVISRGQLFEAVYDSALKDDYFFFITQLGIRTINIQQLYYPYESIRKDLYPIEYKGRAARGNLVSFNNALYISTAEYELYRIEYSIQK